MAQSIDNLRIYVAARELEDRVFELVKGLEPNRAYPFGNDLRRSSAAVCHYLTATHESFSYTMKLDSLMQARVAAETTQRLLSELGNDAVTLAVQSGYTGVIKQAWGLVHYVKAKREERRSHLEISAKDELVAARA